ncbi:hypothetical protein Hypma_008351 [Hypsizygus marmoreus]|uniref:Uncharacterized protein n=1 Tax=Hypsizygus marmoreus TaxID=39966 RepID=A0A151V543_HYPMA|nr:hypothetical protein Hypma_005490 [Hypsizygus marmoreus]RDB24393.1 hypothetical protein Hypma_008351 [Hypsizygus marmoreus]
MDDTDGEDSDIQMEEAQSSPLVMEWESEEPVQEDGPEFDEETQYDFRSYKSSSPRLIQGFLEPNTDDDDACEAVLYEVLDPVSGCWCTLPDGYHPSRPPSLSASPAFLEVNLQSQYVFEHTLPDGPSVRYSGFLRKGDQDEYDTQTLMSDFNLETWYPIPEGYLAPMVRIAEQGTVDGGGDEDEGNGGDDEEGDDGGDDKDGHDDGDHKDGHNKADNEEGHEEHNKTNAGAGEEQVAKDMSSPSGSSYGEGVKAERRRREFDNRRTHDSIEYTDDSDKDAQEEYMNEAQPTPGPSSKSKGKRKAIDPQTDDDGSSKASSDEEFPQYLLLGSDMMEVYGDDNNQGSEVEDQDQEEGRGGNSEGRSTRPTRHKTGPYSKRENRDLGKLKGNFNNGVDWYVGKYNRPCSEVVNKLVPSIKPARQNSSFVTYKRWFSMRHGNARTKGLELAEWTAFVTKQYRAEYMALDEEGRATMLAQMQTELSSLSSGGNQSTKSQVSGFRLCEAQNIGIAQAYWDRRNILIVGVIMSLDSDPVLPQLQTSYAGDPRVRKLLQENKVPVRNFIDQLRSGLKTVLDGGSLVLPVLTGSSHLPTAAGPSRLPKHAKRIKEQQTKDHKDGSSRDNSRTDIPAAMREIHEKGGIKEPNIRWVKYLSVLIDNTCRLVDWFDEYPDLGKGLRIGGKDGMNAQRTVALAEKLKEGKVKPRIVKWTKDEKAYSLDSEEYLDMPLIIGKSGKVLSRVRDSKAISEPSERGTKRKASGPATGDDDPQPVEATHAQGAPRSTGTTQSAPSDTQRPGQSRVVNALPARAINTARHPEDEASEPVHQRPRKRRREDEGDSMAMDDVAPRFDDGYTVVGGPFREPDVRVRGRMVAPPVAGRSVIPYQPSFYPPDRHGPTLYRRHAQGYDRPGEEYYRDTYDDGMGIGGGDYGPPYAGVNAYPVGVFPRVREGRYQMERREY